MSQLRFMFQCDGYQVGLIRESESKSFPEAAKEIKLVVEALKSEGFTPTQSGRPRLTLTEGAACPTCKTGLMLKRTGRNGDFLGCSRYPECKTTAQLQRI